MMSHDPFTQALLALAERGAQYGDDSQDGRHAMMHADLMQSLRRMSPK